ncbi:MAG: VWA domain-containing protein [Acetobacteraceae bacterium]|nr:VWA domain-containing protein [Acetobacteraceae bacterium]
MAGPAPECGSPGPAVDRLCQRFPGLASLAQGLDVDLSRGGAARVGEAGVLSLCLHLSGEEPGAVRVDPGADAGRVFYGRRRAGEVLHLDLFHQAGEVDHRQVAEAVGRAVRRYWRDFPLRPGASQQAAVEDTLDHIDVQTATGGGRVSGSLAFGRKPSLRRAHLNHVHLALLRDPWTPALPFYLVAALEEEVARQGLETRRIDRVEVVWGRGRDGLDLSDYTAPSDSWLKEAGPREGRGPGGRPAAEGPGKGDGDGGGGGAGQDGEGAGQAAGAPGDPAGLYASELADVLELAGDSTALRELRSLLERVARGSRDELSPVPGPGRPLDPEADPGGLLEALREKGLVRSDGRRVVLTPAGERLRLYLEAYRDDVLRMLRRLARRRPRALVRVSCRGGPVPAPSRSRRGRRGRLARPMDLAWADQLAVAESLARAAGEGPGPSGRLRLDRRHLLFLGRQGAAPPEVCLLLDSSASMAGRRIRAARQLAHHLVLSTRSRVAVLTFQERHTRVLCPFTRDRRRLEAGLERMQAFGLTPLAGALCDCLEFLRASRCRSPLLLLVSDGVPTVPRWSLNPVVDALKAGSEVRRRRVNFVCVGLEPSRPFLERLAKAASGRLYVVEELDRDALVAIARQEGERA